jgi:AraC family transcriptional regulator, regulatory protein of adaptative response / DNA-3-methyladenine glycosylase II
VSAGARGEISRLLRYQPPYDWPATLDFLGRRAIPGIELVADGAYWRTIALDGGQGVVSVRPGEGDALRAAIRFPKLSALPTIIARLRRVFDLAADPIAIAAHLARDPRLCALVAARPGLRAPGAWDGFESAIRALLGHRLAIPAAADVAGRLAAAFRERLNEPIRGLTHVFPEPKELSGAELTGLGIAPALVSMLNAVAVQVVADPELFGASRAVDDTARRLRSIRGMGEGLAQYIAARQLREPDAFPAADATLRLALTDADGRRPEASQLLARAESWRPWRA